MKNILFLLLTTSAMLLTGCNTVPTDDIKISAQADPKVNFNGHKTYTWLGSAGILKDPEGKWEPPQFDADAEITFLIDRELRKRGMTETTNKPDVVIAYALGVDMAALKTKINPESKISVLQNVPQGALMVMLVDADTGFVIWAGTASAEIKNQGADSAKQRLDYAISSMFKQLPK